MRWDYTLGTKYLKVIQNTPYKYRQERGEGWRVGRGVGGCYLDPGPDL